MNFIHLNFFIYNLNLIKIKLSQNIEQLQSLYLYLSVVVLPKVIEL